MKRGPPYPHRKVQPRGTPRGRRGAGRESFGAQEAQSAHWTWQHSQLSQQCHRPSQPPGASWPPSRRIGVGTLEAREPSEAGTTLGPEPGPDSRSWSPCWPSWHWPGRVAWATPAPCQAHCRPVLIDVISCPSQWRHLGPPSAAVPGCHPALLLHPGIPCRPSPSPAYLGF